MSFYRRSCFITPSIRYRLYHPPPFVQVSFRYFYKKLPEVYNNFCRLAMRIVPPLFQSRFSCMCWVWPGQHSPEETTASWALLLGSHPFCGFQFGLTLSVYFSFVAMIGADSEPGRSGLFADRVISWCRHYEERDYFSTDRLWKFTSSTRSSPETDQFSML